MLSPRLILEIDIRKFLAVAVFDDKATGCSSTDQGGGKRRIVIANRAMSALGQKQTLRCACPMSALPPKADMDQHCRDVRFVPKADIAERD